jgi:hypothetical protein
MKNITMYTKKSPQLFARENALKNGETNYSKRAMQVWLLKIEKNKSSFCSMKKQSKNLLLLESEHRLTLYWDRVSPKKRDWRLIHLVLFPLIRVLLTDWEPVNVSNLMSYFLRLNLCAIKCAKPKTLPLILKLILTS